MKTVVEHKVNGNTVTRRVHSQGAFTGTLCNPQGTFPGNGNPVDIEYQPEQEFNNASRLTRFSADHKRQAFMRQRGLG